MQRSLVLLVVLRPGELVKDLFQGSLADRVLLNLERCLRILELPEEFT